MVFFVKHLKSAMTLFSVRNLVPARKQENDNPAWKMVKEFGNSQEINLLENSVN